MRFIVLSVALLAGIFTRAQPSVDVIDYINNYKNLAIEEMSRTGIPASIKLAQGIHETFAGKSALVLRSNNHFGIKCKSSWSGKKVYHDDDARGECFRSYETSIDSYRDHSDFLKHNQRYAFLFDLDPEDYEGWAYGLKKAGYATNIKYSQILIKLIENYNLQQYSLIAMGKLSPKEELFARSPTTFATKVEPTNTAPVISVENNLPIAEDAPEINYPRGQFAINNTKVIYAHAGVSLLNIANEYDIAYSRLLEFNDMKDIDVLVKGQLIFLQRKRKTGANEFHTVDRGESLLTIAQLEGIRLESLAALNHLDISMQPAPGEKLNLHHRAAKRPILVGESVVRTLVADNETVENIQKLHIVQGKETLYSISKKYGVEMQKIREWNRLASTDLRIGQELVIQKY